MTYTRIVFHAIAAIVAVGAMHGAAHAATAEHVQSVAITNVTVIDAAHARRVAAQTVLLEGDRILAIGKTGSVGIPADALRVEGRGKYLIPGLVDMHVHLFNNSSHRPPNDWMFPLFVANGVTGVREMLSLPEQIAQIARWRDAVEKGELIAPRVLAAGVAVWAKDDAAARQQVRAAKTAGADFIKVFSELPAPQWRAVLDEAHVLGIAVDGHVPADVALTDSARAGQRTAEHLMQAYEACSSIEARALKERAGLAGDKAVALRDEQEREILETFDASACKRAATSVAAAQQVQVPTLVLAHFENSRAGVDLAADPRWPLLRADEQARWQRALADNTPEDAKLAASRWDISCRIVRALHAAGVPILAGTDTPMPLNYPGYSLHDELELLVSCGLSNAEALRSATSGPADLLKLMATTGSVDLGKRADLVLLDADPLNDIHNLRRIQAVILAGRVLPRDKLDHLAGTH
jgi:imidazolonepropionase-like amidohydrolase